jgi:hypothetical protein
VIDVEPDDVPAEIQDGETIDPHSMDPMTMLRFVRAIGGWPGRAQVIACEPAIALVLETVAELRTDAAYPTP